MLFNEPSEVYLPANDMLRVSGGKWSTENFVRCTQTETQSVNDSNLLVGQKITQAKTRFDVTWTPDDFMEHIAKTFKTGKKINKHWRQQIDFIRDLSNFTIVIRMEDFNNSWQAQLDYPAPKIISNQSSNTILQFDRQRLYEIYQNDFLALGYDVK